MKLVHSVIVSAFFLHGVALAQDATPERPAALELSGWMKTFAEDELPDRATIVMPESYESVLETDMRAAIMQALERQGYSVVSEAGEDADVFILTYRADVKERGVRRLPESPIGIAQDPGDAARNEYGGRPVDPGFAPTLRLNRNKGKEPEGPFVDLKITIRQGTSIIWTGYAHSEIGASTRSAVTRAVSARMLEAIGKSVTDEDARFSIGR